MKIKKDKINWKGIILALSIIIVILFIMFLNNIVCTKNPDRLGCIGFNYKSIQSELEYNIWKEECRNEEIEIGKPILIRDYEISVDGKTERIKEYIKAHNNTTLIICKKFEVDNITIENRTCVTGVTNKDESKEFYRTDCGYRTTNNLINKFAELIKGKPVCSPCMNYDQDTQTPIEFREITISKQDLTIELLHTTCKCVVMSEEPPKIKGISSLWRTCLTYKCDDYFIEVNK